MKLKEVTLTTSKPIAPQIRQIRLFLNITQKELATKMGKGSNNSISQYERGGGDYNLGNYPTPFAFEMLDAMGIRSVKFKFDLKVDVTRKNRKL